MTTTLTFDEKMDDLTYGATQMLLLTVEKIRDSIQWANRKYGKAVIDSVTRDAVGGLTMQIQETLFNAREYAWKVPEEEVDEVAQEAIDKIAGIASKYLRDYNTIYKSIAEITCGGKYYKY